MDAPWPRRARIGARDRDNKLKRPQTDRSGAGGRPGGAAGGGSSARGRGAGLEDPGQLVGARHLPGPRRHRRLARRGAPRRPRARPGSRARARPALGLPRAAAAAASRAREPRRRARALAAAELGARGGSGPLRPAGPRRVRRVRRRAPGRPGLRGGPAGLGPPLAAGRLLEPRPRGPPRAGRALPLRPRALLLLAAGRQLLWFPNVVLPLDLPSRVWASLVGRVGGWGWMRWREWREDVLEGGAYFLQTCGGGSGAAPGAGFVCGTRSTALGPRRAPGPSPRGAAAARRGRRPARAPNPATPPSLPGGQPAAPPPAPPELGVPPPSVSRPLPSGWRRGPCRAPASSVPAPRPLRTWPWVSAGLTALPVHLTGQLLNPGKV